MVSLARLNEVAQTLNEHEIGELLDFARYLKAKREATQRAALAALAFIAEEDEGFYQGEVVHISRVETIAIEEAR